MKLFVQRSRAQLETKDHPTIDPSAFRKWPPGGPRLRNARNLSCLSPTQSGEFDKFQWSEHGPQAIFCQPSPFRPFWGRQNGHSVEGENSRHKMTSAPGRRSGAHSSVQKSTTTIYKNRSTKITSHHWEESEDEYRTAINTQTGGRTRRSGSGLPPSDLGETRLLPTRLQIVPATDRGGDRAALGCAGPEGPQFPSPPAQTAGIGSFSTNGSRKGVSVRVWHSSCDR